MKGLVRTLGMSVGLISLAAVAERLVTETADFSGGVVPDGWAVAASGYLSPEYSNSVSRIEISYAATGQVGEAQLFALSHGSSDQTQIASVNTFTTGAAFDFPETSDYRRFRIAANGLTVGSFSATWRDRRRDAPTNVVAAVLTASSLEVAWDEVDGAAGYEVSVWTNVVTGASEGMVVWEDMLPGATNGASSTIMSETKFNNCFANVGWTRSEKAGYPTGEEGTIQIGITDTSGWLQTPPLAVYGPGVAVRFRARVVDANSNPMIVERVSGSVTQHVGEVTLSTTTQDCFIPVPDWQSGDCLRFNSPASGKRRTVIGAFAVISGYSEGTATPDVLRVVAAGGATSCAIAGLPESTIVYVGVRTLADEGLSSDVSEGVKVDLSKVSVLNAVQMGTLSGNVYLQNFDGLAGHTSSSEEKEFFNGVTVPFLQAWQDDNAASSITFYTGGNQSGARFMALATDVSSNVRAFGARGKQGTTMVWGISFTNDTDSAMTITNISYSSQQWGFVNSTNQALGLACLVTNRLDWIVNFADGWSQCVETDAGVFGLGSTHGMPESTDVDYVPPGGIRIAPGEVMYLKWTLFSPSSGGSAAMAIDDLKVAFDVAAKPLLMIVR